MFESTPEQIRWLASRVGDAAVSLRDGHTGIGTVTRGAFGDTAGGIACAGAVTDAASSGGTATEHLQRELRSDVDKLTGVAANYQDTDAAGSERMDSIDVYTTHLSGGRPDQIAGAWDVVGESAGHPTVLTGDFNTRLDDADCPPGNDDEACDPRSRAQLGRHDELGFTDAGADAGPTSGHGERGNRIDYILANGVDPVGTEVIDGGPSDHEGLVTDLVLPDSNPWDDERESD
jgi:hypothetical protein